MYYLETGIDPRDAFVVALTNAFQRAGAPLTRAEPGHKATEGTHVRLDLQVDGVTVCASLPVAEPPGRTEFLEDNPDMLEIAVHEFLVRQAKRLAASGRSLAS